jgi:hypothetical protein
MCHMSNFIKVCEMNQKLIYFLKYSGSYVINKTELNINVMVLIQQNCHRPSFISIYVKTKKMDVKV